MSQYSNPTGFFGRLLARGMAWGHRDFYKNTARVLDLKEDDTYLEIGFGSGLFIKKYASHVSRIAGLDCSEEMVRLAKDMNKDLVRSGKAEFVQGDASSLPWKDNEFSAMAAIETFFFWSDPQGALREAYRVMKPGGRLVLEMAYNKDDGLDHAGHIRKMNLRLYSGEELSDLLTSAGFDDISFEYYKSFWIPLKGHMVPKGMVVKAVKSEFKD
ncbi:MAG TPA: class I SAM-dependent methyltransferase [Candidatus Methanofastidiosa archaeon]|nr:class I SAM-dependent methyltransferase [Candidatus Methanofastidiosa archaeon]